MNGDEQNEREQYFSLTLGTSKFEWTIQYVVVVDKDSHGEWRLFIHRRYTPSIFNGNIESLRQMWSKSYLFSCPIIIFPISTQSAYYFYILFSSVSS